MILINGLWVKQSCWMDKRLIGSESLDFAVRIVSYKDEVLSGYAVMTLKSYSRDNLTKFNSGIQIGLKSMLDHF